MIEESLMHILGGLGQKPIHQATSSKIYCFGRCAKIPIIYWQAKEIDRVLNECDPEGHGINVSLLEHISPVEWENVVLYGEYVLNRDLVRRV